MSALWILIPVLLFIGLFVFASCRVASDYDRQIEAWHIEQERKKVMNA